MYFNILIRLTFMDYLLGVRLLVQIHLLMLATQSVVHGPPAAAPGILLAPGLLGPSQTS